MPKLFDGTLATSVTGDYRIALGKPNEAGSINMTFATLLSLASGSEVLEGAIQNVDLDSGDNYSLTINHAKGKSSVIAALYDGDGEEQATSNIFRIIDGNYVKFTFNAPITGTWSYILIFY